MSTEEKAVNRVQVNLSDEAFDALMLLHRIHDKTLGEMARELLERTLLGEAHVLRLEVERRASKLAAGNRRKSQEKE